MKLLALFFFILLFFTSQEMIAINSSISDNPDSVEVNYAKALINEVNQNGSLSDLIDNSVPAVLPIGISKTIAGKKVSIVLDSIVFTTQGGYVTAYTAIQNPNSNDTVLAFKGTDIQFNQGGFSGDARLELLADAKIKLVDSASITFKKQGTYVDWNCDGFKQMGLDCEITFNRDFIVPENPDGTIDSTGKQVSSLFQTTIQSWDDFLLDISLTPFQFTKLKGFGFYVTNAVFDFSENLNSSSIVFPPNYMTPSMPEPNSPFWQGFFLKEMQIKLPPEYSSSNSNERITFSANNILIDDLGFTGRLSGYNLLDIGSGSAGGWAFSLDTFSVNILTNNFVDTKLSGKIQLPITDEDDALYYKGYIDNSGDFSLAVDLSDTLNVDMWSAKLTLFDNSSISILRKNKKFIASANLNGKISIQKDGDGNINFDGIEFQGLKLQNVEPYFDIQSVSLCGENQGKMASFPVSIYNIGFVKQGNDIGLGMDLAVNLVGEGDNGFSADAGFDIWATMDNSDGRTHFIYKEITFKQISIDVDAGAYKIKGLLNIYKNDPIYGRGFKGSVDATFIPTFSVKVAAQFGKVNDMRYWFADGLLTLPSGIPVFTGFGLYGFGGGAYYHMKRTNASSIQIPTDPSQNPSTNTNQAGESASGIVYVPDATSFLGIKASVIIGTYPSADAFNATATFEIAFNGNGGVNFIGFQGDAYFMTPILERGTNSKIRATTDISYDFTNKVLHGETSVYVNFPHLIVGSNPNNLAGTSIIHFEPGKWYITVGTPDQRVGLKIIDIFTLTSYFMIGNQIPDIPPLPDKVTSITGDINPVRDANALTSGSGFALGASLDVSVSGEFWRFYGDFSAGIGFDVMLKNYGTGTHCVGSSSPIGINGWYAQGQAYAYLDGKIGINIPKGIFAGKYEILKLQAAAVLQAKLPNPFWMQGNVVGRYSILNGLISGSCNYEFTIGELCQIESGNEMGDIKVIADMSPSENEEDVDVFNNPQLAFNMKVDKVIEYVDVNNIKKTFRIKFDYFKVISNGSELPGTLRWNSDNDVVAFTPKDILPGQSKITLSAKVHFEKLENNVWTTVMVDGKPVEETKELDFTSGEAPDYIPASNVAYSYPVDRQLNFYKNEVPYGLIQLKQGQDYLFTPDDEWVKVARIKSVSGFTDFSYNYDDNSNKISFTTPANMQNDKIYQFLIVNKPANSIENVDENVENDSIVIADETGNNMNINTQNIEGSYTHLIEKEMYSFYFKTSKYNTFSEKIDALQVSAPFSWPIYNGVHKIGLNMAGTEYFDKYEMEGDIENAPLIRILTDNNNTWYNNYTYPMIYCPLLSNCTTNFPSSISITWRDTAIVGVPPVQTNLFTLYPDESYELTDQNIESNVVIFNSSFVQLTNIMDFYQYTDYENIKNNAAMNPERNTNQALINILTKPYPSMLAGYPNYYYYKVKFNYYIPGSSTPSSTKIINIGY